VETVEIKKEQAIQWAQEKTLESLLRQGANANKLLGVMAKALDPKQDKDQIDKWATLITAVQKQTTSTENQTKAERTVEDATDELRRAFKESASSFKGLLGTDPNMMFNGIGYAFKDLKRELEILGSPLSKLAGGIAIAAEVFQLIYSRGTEMANAIFDMYDAGLVFTDGISELANEAAATGLDLQTLSKVLTKHGQVVATMGIKRTAELGKAFNLATQGGTELGMTFEQAQDTLLSYTEQQRLSGQLRNKSDDEIIAGAKDYGAQLNRLSQLTGQRREQIDQEIKQNAKRPDVNILLSTLNDSLRESTKQGLSELQVLGPEMAGTFQDMIIAAKTGGLPAMFATNENMTQMLQQSGQLNNFMALVDATVHGNKNQMDNLIEQIGAGSQAFARSNALYTKLGGAQSEQVNLASGIAVQSRNISERNKELLEAMAVDKDAQRIKSAQQDITSSFNALNQALSDLASRLLAPLAKPFAMLIGGLTGLATVAVKVVDALAYLLYPLEKIGDFFSYLADVGKLVLGSAGAPGTLGAAALDTAALAGTVATVLLGGGLLKRILMSPQVLGMFTGPWMTRILGSAMSLFRRIPGMGMFSRIGSLGGGGTGGVGSMFGMGKLVDGLKGFGTAISGTITTVAETISKVSGSLMTTIANIGKGLGELLTSLGDGIGKALGSMGKGLSSAFTALSDSLGKAIASVSEGLGKAFASIASGIGKGVGVALGAILEGLSVGLKAMADPMILLGAAILGGSITLIGAGIAGAAWIMGAAMPKLAEGLRAFTEIDGEKLEKTGMGMIKIGAGLIAMGVGEVANVWGSLASGIASFFGADPITKLKRFGEIAEPLQKGSDAMAAFAVAYPKSIAAINNSVLDPQAMASFDKLKEIFAGDGVFTSMGKWLFGNQDFVTQLVKLGESTDNIPTFASRLTGFADAYSYLVEAFNQPINAEALANLVGLTSLINKQAAASNPGILGGLFGGSSATETAAAAPPTPGVTTAAARVAHITPDQKHQQMMDMLSQLNDNMSALLAVEDRQTRVMSDGFSGISGVIH
jgi:hypothetical protein